MTAAVRAVYFIEADNGLIKIGSAADPARRFTTIRASAPMPVRLVAWIPGAGFAGERALHKRFAEQRVCGEWFAPSPDLRTVIAEATRDHPVLPTPSAVPRVSHQRPRAIGDRVAAEVRAEMARQRKTCRDIAGALGISAAQVGKRMTGKIVLDVRELGILAEIFGVPLVSLVPVDPQPDTAERAS